ncbi:AarF/UbiB family protein [Agrococcus sp. ProA11]|uniref:ABC1 kinase family protein n=1 Tax=Agrococcus chionoecetis TaxID=3153752 RepID=UPI003260C1C8
MTAADHPRARYRRILRFAARHLAITWWFEILLPRLGLSALAARGRSRRMTRFARRFHALAIDLGGLMIKVGQFMSSRLDVLPPEITRELEGLQDEAPEVPFEPLRRAIEDDLGMPLERAFDAIEREPLAAASLGQAHRVTLARFDADALGSDQAVVKVQRPGIQTIVDVDLAALRVVGRWLSRVRLVSDRVDMPVLVEEFATTSLAEIDYLQEAANAERFAADFADQPRVAVPHVVWERTTRRVLTLADVTAIKLTDLDALRAAGIDPREVAQEFARVMFDQLFVHGFCHADPHPGNLFVTPSTDADSTDGASTVAWQLTFIDFGMMGRVPESTRRGLRTLLIAAAARDGHGMVEAMREVGALLPSADTAELERAMQHAFARFGGMGFAELREVDPREFRDFALEFQELMRALPFQLPEDFLLVIRAMSLTSGVCSSLDPAFNLWDAVEPYSARLLRDERGNLAQDVARSAFTSARRIVQLPARLDAVLTRAEEGRLAVSAPKAERSLVRLERVARQLVSAVLFAGLAVAGALLRDEQEVLGTTLLVIAVVPLLHAVLAGLAARRRRR